ncbi:MAG TPA: sugar phosphate nucleotidyltransferase [Candidatus Binataceae bacterium]|nr:sugar phosphate nucleotidyltransferase [Candidatus Binataceae bacterium]
MDRDQTSQDKKTRAALILAGGEGTRLAELTQRADGVHVPKRFCRLVGEVSLLEQIRQRAVRSVSPDCTFLVLNRSHELFYRPSVVGGGPSQNLIVQPRNGGTVAGLYASVDAAFIGQNGYLFCASEGLATAFSSDLGPRSSGPGSIIESRTIRRVRSNGWLSGMNCSFDQAIERMKDGHRARSSVKVRNADETGSAANA